MNPAKFGATKYHIKYVPAKFKEYSNLFSWTKRPAILDVGTGPGHMLLEIEPLLPGNYSEIVATDRSEEMIRHFNSLFKDSRISGRQLDIETKNLPTDLKNRFDFAFSSNCFHFVSNFSQAFGNCSKVLKPNGELFFIWCKKCSIHDIYKDMSRIDKWSSFLNDYKNWRHPFDNEDPTGTVEDVMKKVGLNVLKAELLEDIVFYDDMQPFIDLFDSLDFLSVNLPKIDITKFKEDYHKACLSYLYVDENAQNGRQVRHMFPSIAVAARKV